MAMAGRVPPDAVRPVLDRLDADRPDPDPEPDAHRVLTERILTAALERQPEEGESRAGYLDLRLRRADARRAAGQADLAVSDYEKLLDEIDALDPATAEAVYRGLVPARLDAGRHADALEAASVFLLPSGRPIADDPLLIVLVDAGLRAVDLGRPGVGVDLHEGVLQLAGGRAVRLRASRRTDRAARAAGDFAGPPQAPSLMRFAGFRAI